MDARIQLVEQVGAVWTRASSSARGLRRVVAATTSRGTTEVLLVRAVLNLVGHVSEAGVVGVISAIHGVAPNGAIVGAVAAKLAGRVGCGGRSASIGPAVT